jgi:glycerophosphoryl diester phosphodiesterase family protein
VGFEIQAHRGNDPLTIRRLLAASPSSLELDLGLADGRLVVAHDLDHGDASGLSFERALELAGDTPVMIDAKCFPPATPAPREFVQALRPLLTRLAVCSFSEPLLAEIARLRGSVETTILFDRPQPIMTVARTLGPRHDVVTRDLVEAAHALGLRVVPWTVNHVRRMSELVALGVDGLVTDEPALAREVAQLQLAAVA